MAEGLFVPGEYNYPTGFPKAKILFSLVKVKPKRKLIFDIFTSKEEADKWSTGFEVDSLGFETMRAGYCQEDIDLLSDPEFSQQIVNFEFSKLYKSNSNFPVETYLKGSASGFFIGDQGHIVTNYHIASGIIEASGFDREGYNSGELVAAPSIEVEILKEISPDGSLVYRSCDKVYLAGCYSRSDAYGQGLDLAVLKIDINPETFLDATSRSVDLHQQIYSFGFPMRTCRSHDKKNHFGYDDANYDLRVSTGLVVKKDSNIFWSDCDGGPGSSGSLAVDCSGRLLGVYSGSLGNGLKDYSGVLRRHCHGKCLNTFKFLA